MNLRYVLAIVAFSTGALAADTPYRVAPDLFDLARPDDLGLKPAPGVQTFTIFRATDKTDNYVNGVVLLPFNGKLYAQWQSSARDEDTADTWVAYATSSDGEHWSVPAPVVPRDGTMRSSGGWWTNDKTLVAYLNVWNADVHTGGHTEFVTSADGRHWSKPRPVTDVDGKPLAGVIEQDVHALPDGRLVTAFHVQPGRVAVPYYTDDPTGVSGWVRGAMTNLAHEGLESREMEPAWFRRADGCLVMVFRDQAKTYRQLAAQSCDRGVTWTTPVLTAMPDSPAKQSAGNLPDGTAFLVNEPSGAPIRAPLAVTLSKDGKLFDRAFLLRGAGAALPVIRIPGKFKRMGYHYPKSVVWKDFLYVSYATNKQDVELTRVPLPIAMQ